MAGENIRNIAIIAHVDHGKTTLIDNMHKQSANLRENQEMVERFMDSNDLERERGITILAKCMSLFIDQVNGKNIKINVIDTPGHADFGGEVERVLSMVDGVILLVDASEGPMPQTKFVLSKALALGLLPIVVINKVDRPDARIDEVHNEILELFMALDATDAQMDFPMLYASGRAGWASKSLEAPRENLVPLFEVIESYVPAPKVDENSPFSLLVTLLDSDPYVGRVLIGKVYSGKLKVNATVKSISLDGKLVEQAKITKLFTFKGNQRTPSEEVSAGDIVAIAGLENTSVADTVCDLAVTNAIKSTPIDPPTMAVTISVNDSPLAGREGSKVTSRVILDRLLKEAESNVAITVKQTGEAFEVGGRGELQLGVLIETMRREGFELSISKPRVLFKKDEKGGLLEPIEEAVLDVDDGYSGVVVEKLAQRKGDMVELKPSGGGKVRIIFHIPSRGLIGYQSEFKNDTRGTGVMSRLFHSYQPYKGDIVGRTCGVLVSNSDGEAVEYALWNLEERGILFVTPKTKVYEGMIIGQNSRDNDLDVNPIKGKQLTNMRASGTDESTKLRPARLFTLEEVISYIEDDELVEVTPQSIRLRKRYLNPNDRKKASRTKEVE